MELQQTTFDKQRLQQLIDFHRSGRATHSEFTMHHTSDGNQGCAAGELPNCFPDQWRFTDKGRYHAIELIEGSTGSEATDVEKFFDASAEEINFLFTSHYCSVCNGMLANSLTDHSTREQWIEQAETFLTTLE